MKVQLDFADLSSQQRYKVLTGLIAPRPIALVTTVSRENIVNTAPFSLFNMFSTEPALVVIGIEARADGSLKDTTRNARETGVFVVNLVDEALAPAMNECAVDFPPEMSEPEILGLKLVPGRYVPVPHLAAAPAALECLQTEIVNVGRYRDLLIGEVVGVQSRVGIIDPATLRTDFDAYKPIGRLAGSLYTRQHDRFEMHRETFDEWKRRKNFPSQKQRHLVEVPD